MNDSEKLQDLLRTNKSLFDETILNFLPVKTKSEEIQTLYEMMRDYPRRGGKGIRGSTCLLWCELFGGRKDNAVVTASALELFQNWILIHDDIEDGSEMRRGLPALHKKFGVELAINAGDALHGKMWELLLTNRKSVGAEITLDILSEFSRMLDETTEGQQMELSWNFGNNWNIKEEDYLLMVTKKAAWYTCITPAKLGVLLSTSRKDDGWGKISNQEDIMNKIETFGTHLGIAFQIVDDVLNLTADESKYGKEILGDLYEGKRTLMVIHLLQTVSVARRTEIVNVLSKPREQKTPDEIRSVFELMTETGAIQYARNVANKHSQIALNLFEDITNSNQTVNLEIRDFTRYLLGYLTSRDY